MSTPKTNSTRRPTSSLTGAADPTSNEINLLKHQLDECNEARGRWFRFRFRADAAHAFFAGRSITIAVAVLLVVMIALALLDTTPWA